jgi:hypothetical protein
MARYRMTWRSIVLAISFLVVFPLAWAHFQGRSASLKEVVTAAELERASSTEPYLVYRGIDGPNHWFATRGGRVFLVPVGAIEIPHSYPMSQGIALFVDVKDGKLRPPDAARVADEVNRGVRMPGPRGR